MKKIVATTLAITALFLPSATYAEDLVKEEFSEVKYEPLVLKKEYFDGVDLTRIYEYEKTHKPYFHTIEIPEGIRKNLNQDNPNYVDKVITQLARYYNQVGNVQSLNELFYQYIPETPGSKISFSEDYAPIASEHLENAIEDLDNGQPIKITKQDKILVEQKYGDNAFQKEFVPFKSQEQLITKSKELAEDLRIKWYEKTITYVILGIGFLLSLILFILYKRR